MKAPDIRLVTGRGGSGKSFLVRSWLAKIKGRKLIFDTAAEDENAKIADLVTADRGWLVSALQDKKMKTIVWRGLKDGDWDFVNRCAYAAENLTLVWEEVDSFFRPGQYPEWGFQIVNQGRHRDIRIIACARRPQRVSRDLTMNASRITAFNTREPAAVKYYLEYIGEEARALPDLAPYTALDWQNGQQATVKKSLFP